MMFSCPRPFRLGVLCAALLLALAACSKPDDNLTLQCEGQRRMLRGDVQKPGTGVRESVQERSERYELQSRKLDGLRECQVWNASEIRCTYSKPDGTLSRDFRLDRDNLRVRDQVFSRGRTLTENLTFEGECQAL